MDRPFFAPPVDAQGREYKLTGFDTKYDDYDWFPCTEKMLREHNVSAYPYGYFIHYVQKGMEKEAKEDNASDVEDNEHVPWKIHITTRDYYAVEKLVELAFDQKLPHIKISSFRDYEWFFQNPKEKQAGKTAIFYMYENNAAGEKIDWKKVAILAEAIVQLHGGPGLPVSRDKQIEGSTALFYRNDLSQHGFYMARDGLTEYLRLWQIPDHMAYNVGGRTDPLEGMKLEMPTLEQIRQISKEAERNRTGRH